MQSMENLYNIIVEIINNPYLQKRILKSVNYHDFLNTLMDFM